MAARSRSSVSNRILSPSPAPSRALAASPVNTVPAALDLWLSRNPEKAWAEWFFLRYPLHPLNCCSSVLVSFALGRSAVLAGKNLSLGSWCFYAGVLYWFWPLLMVVIHRTRYSLVWPLLFGSWCVSGLHLQVGDFGNLFVTITIGSPNFLGPLLFSPAVLSEKNSEPSAAVPWHGRYWFKFNLWIAVFTFVASYFWTEYFFDVLRMNYNFPHLTWNLDAVLLGVHLDRIFANRSHRAFGTCPLESQRAAVVVAGRGRQRVPLMMYFHAHYFFVTYHAASIVVIRRARHAVRRLEAFTRVNEIDRTSESSQYTSSRLGGRDILCSCLARALAVLPYVGTAVAFAWLEIYATSKQYPVELSWF